MNLNKEIPKHISVEIVFLSSYKKSSARLRMIDASQSTLDVVLESSIPGLGHLREGWHRHQYYDLLLEYMAYMCKNGKNCTKKDKILSKPREKT